MKISLEELIALITQEVLKELKNRGIQVDGSSKIGGKENNVVSKKIDFTGYITPLVTEEKVIELEENISEIIVPKNTIITSSAMDIIRVRKIKINKLN